MEWSILFMGPTGSGKTSAIRSTSEIEAISTNSTRRDRATPLMPGTTTSLDLGMLRLQANDKLRLISATEQLRLDFTWDILLWQAKGIVLMISHKRKDPLADLDHHLHALEQRLAGHKLPLVVGISHIDSTDNVAREKIVAAYTDHMKDRCPSFVHVPPPVFALDARDPEQIRPVLLVMVALIEMAHRFGRGRSVGRGIPVPRIPHDSAEYCNVGEARSPLAMASEGKMR